MPIPGEIAFIDAFIENFEKGEKIGAEKERTKAYQEKIESAKNFLKMGLSIEQVSQAIGISVDEIRKPVS